MDAVRAQIKKAVSEKKWQRVVTLAQKQLRLGNVRLWILNTAGTAYFHLQDHANELRIATKAITVAPRNALILWNYAHALNNADKHKEAIREFQNLRRMSSRTILQFCELRSSRSAEALKNDCLYGIGTCYWNLQRWSDAARYYRKCVRRRREVGSTYSIREIKKSLKKTILWSRIEKAYDNRQWRRAEIFLKQHLKLTPNHVDSLYLLSSAYYEQSQYDKALKMIKRAYALEPYRPVVLWHYANALTMVGEFRKALAFYRKIMDKGLDRIVRESGPGIRWAQSLVNDTRYRMGRAYGKLGERKKAIQLLKEHIRHRKPGLPSLYTWTDLKESLAEFA
jgi:tetratricopeptide (TPR) repeat protein